jgi:hypothetical protein
MIRLFYRLLARLLAMVLQLAYRMGWGSEYTRAEIAETLAEYREKVL